MIKNTFLNNRVSKHESVSVAIPYNQYLEFNGQLYCQSSFHSKQSVHWLHEVMTIALSGNESQLQLSIKNIFHHNWSVTCIEEQALTE